MKRILGLAVLLLCANALHGTSAMAQCGASCSPVVNADLKIIGWGCVENPDNPQTCRATTRGCTMESCGGLAVIRDTKGTVLASAELCGRKVREIRHVAIVPATGSARVQVAVLSHVSGRSHDRASSAPADVRTTQ